MRGQASVVGMGRRRGQHGGQLCSASTVMGCRGGMVTRVSTGQHQRSAWVYYRPVVVSERLGQQIGVWMNMLVKVAPPCERCACALGMGVAPPGAVGGREPPSSWSWSSVKKKTAARAPPSQRQGTTDKDPDRRVRGRVRGARRELEDS